MLIRHSSRHYGHFVSGQHCAGAGRGDVLSGVGILKKRSRVPTVLQPIEGFRTELGIDFSIVSGEFLNFFTSHVIVQLSLHVVLTPWPSCFAPSFQCWYTRTKESYLFLDGQCWFSQHVWSVLCHAPGTVPALAFCLVHVRVWTIYTGFALTQMSAFIIHQILFLARDWWNRDTWPNNVRSWADVI